MAEWKQFANNPAGRNVGDCSVRAVSKALDVDWETAYVLIAMAGYQMNHMPSSNTVWGAVLRKNGFYRHVLPSTCPDCYTVGDFADEHPHGVYVVGTGNHVVTIVDGTAFDSWDSRREIVSYFWSENETEE